MLGAENVWRFLDTSPSAIKLLERLPTAVTTAIRHISIRISGFGAYRPSTHSVVDNKPTQMEALEQWKALLQTIKRRIKVNNLCLQIDIGDCHASQLIGVPGFYVEKHVRDSQVKIFECVKKELGRPKRLWIKGMLGDDEGKMIEKSAMGDSYDSVSEGKVAHSISIGAGGEREGNKILYGHYSWTEDS